MILGGWAFLLSEVPLYYTFSRISDGLLTGFLRMCMTRRTTIPATAAPHCSAPLPRESPLSLSLSLFFQPLTGCLSTR